MNERFAYLPLEKSDGRYSLDPAYLGKISLRDLACFASLAGVQGLFPNLSDEFLRDIFDSRIQSALLVKGPSYEDLGGKTLSFKQLEEAILERHLITFQYHKNEGSKTYVDAEPYKLVNHGGIWYLAAKDSGRLKSFSFTKIDRLLVSDRVFVPDDEVSQKLIDEDDIWLNPEKTEVVLKIAYEAASYFKRRKLLSNQVIEKELEDGGLIISCKIAHANQILPVIRYWIPSIRVISPEGFQAELEEQLKAYAYPN